MDELWVQLGAEADQKRLLDELLVKCKGTPIKLVVRTVAPLSPTWSEYVKSGVTPVAVITWEKNGIERISLESTSPDTLGNPDWKLTVQTLKDVAGGKIKVEAAKILPLAKDPHVLVRRNALLALAAVANGDQEIIATIEKGLFDAESCVRIGSAMALQKAHRRESANRMIEALGKDSWDQFKYACRDALFAIGEETYDVLVDGMNSPKAEVRELCLNTLYKLAVKKVIKDPGQINQIYALMRRIMRSEPKENWKLRSFALSRLMCLKEILSPQQNEQVIADLTSLVENESTVVVQLHAGESLGSLVSKMTPALRVNALGALVNLYKQYGDQCTRTDAAYGWRIVGNSLRRFGDEGNAVLEDFRKQAKDQWLAYVSYQVLYEIQQEPPKKGKYNLVDKKVAVENHDKYAPAFPGWRKW
ncbi:MAG: HEAT repeat domain-containing protein [Phycisphaerae bacterium]